MEKQELIAQLKDIMPVMDMVDQYNQKLDAIWQRMEGLKTQISASFKWNHSWSTKILVVLLAYVTYLLPKTLQWPYAIILGAIVLYKRSQAKQMFKKEKENWRQELGCVEQEYKAVEQEMLEKLAPHWQKIQSVIPQDYIAPIFVRTAYGYLVNGRADSMKEAVNLFEEEQHRWRMEQGQQQMYEQYQAEIRSLQETMEALEQRVGAAEYDANVAVAYATRGC